MFLNSKPENDFHKKKIITYFFYNNNSTIPELARELNLSIPTVTKLINDLVDSGMVNDYGKGISKVGRKPNTYGLNPRSGYFLGVDIRYNHINIGTCDFNGEIVKQDLEIPLVNAFGQMEQIFEICQLANDFVESCGIEADKILNACVNISGRVNASKGYSYSQYSSVAETPLSEILTNRIGIPTCIENDTRSMTYGEYMRGLINGERNVLYVNLGWGLGLGVVINGVVYEGKSGFAGELGHTHVFNNEIACHCGKKGCLETEVSGAALVRRIVQEIKNGKTSVLSAAVKENPEGLTMNQAIDAILHDEDYLCIDILEDIASILGVQLANMINIFNPEIVVIGGSLSVVGDYLLQPIKQSIMKHSLKLVSSDTKIKCSRLGEKAGVYGACMIARRQMFEKI